MGPKPEVDLLEGLAVGRARLLHVWMDRGRLAWLPWAAGAFAVFGASCQLFRWLQA